MAISERQRHESPERPQPAGAPVAPANEVLRLQSLVGNRAVSELMARAPKSPAKAPERAVTMAELGEYPLTSLNVVADKEFNVTIEPGKDLPKLVSYANLGRAIPSVLITSSSHTIVLTKVYIASVRLDPEPLVILDLSAESVEYR